MELGDLIFPLLIIGSVIVQWLSSRKGEENQNTPPQQSSGKPSNDSSQDPSWDDLMDALGQPSAPPELPPVVPQQKTEPTPPPVPVYRQPERPAHVNLIDQQREKLEEKRRQLELVKQQTKHELSPSTRQLAGLTNKRQQVTTLNLRQMLDNQKSLRQAIVLNEILQPPVSLR